MKIQLFTEPRCTVCQQAKSFLAKCGISFEERDISSDSENERILREELDSCTTPTLVSGAEIIVGFDRQQYQHLAADLALRKPRRRGGL